MPHRLRAVLVGLLAVAVMATLLPAAAGAATRSPRKAVAVKLATSLLKKQLKDNNRQLVEARLSEPVKTRKGAWQFLYDDLAKNGDICTAALVVKFKSPASNTVVASFVRSNCENPGAEVLGIRSAARAFGKAAVKRAGALRDSLQTYEDTTDPCTRLKVPKASETQASQLLTIGLVRAVLGPFDAELDRYAKALQSVGATETHLVNGAAAWRDLVDTTRALPALEPDACSVLMAWAANDYSAETAPVDFAAVEAQTTRLEADIVQVAKTSRHLKRRGLDVGTVVDFSGAGLLDLLVVDSGSVTGKLQRPKLG
jgi:hypothetical protein